MQLRVLAGDSVRLVEVQDRQLLHLPRGIVGFEELSGFALLPLEPPLYLLQSVEDPTVGFVVMDPTVVDPGYGIEVSQEERALLAMVGDDRPECWCIVTLTMDGSPSTANLRAPIVVNPNSRLGSQVILQDGQRQVRHPVRSMPRPPTGHDSPLQRPEKRSGRNGRARSSRGRL